VKQRHVSAYLEAIFRFTKCWLIETNIRPVWLDVVFVNLKMAFR
jgi:hypothetical protein